jgi:hypothetical protein
MHFKRRSALMVFVLLSGILACDLPGSAPTNPSAVGTSLAATLNAAIQGTQQAVVASYSPTFQPPPTLTPTVTLSGVLPLPSQTPTDTPNALATGSLIQLSVSVATNCRVGPGNVYDQVSILPVGKTVQVYARDTTGNFWYIQNPDGSSDFCWVWGQYASVTGLTFTLPIYTPPPTPIPTDTPSPGFVASFSNLVACTGWWPEIRLRNTGDVTFKSISISLKDTVTSTTVYKASNAFNDNPDCTTSEGRKTLLPGKTATVSAPGFTYDPTGHKLRASITLCSDTGQGGTCATETITFTP